MIKRVSANVSVAAYFRIWRGIAILQLRSYGVYAAHSRQRTGDVRFSRSERQPTGQGRHCAREADRGKVTLSGLKGRSGPALPRLTL